MLGVTLPAQSGAVSQPTLAALQELQKRSECVFDTSVTYGQKTKYMTGFAKMSKNKNSLSEIVSLLPPLL